MTRTDLARLVRSVRCSGTKLDASVSLLRLFKTPIIKRCSEAEVAARTMEAGPVRDALVQIATYGWPAD